MLGSVGVRYLVPCDAAVHWVCVLKAVCLFNLEDFVFHSKPLLYERLLTDHALQICHHPAGYINVHIFIIISGEKKKWPFELQFLL